MQDQKSSGHGLKDELAKLTLAAAKPDPNQKLAWVNSICLCILVVGLVGARSAPPFVKPPSQRTAEAIPALLEPPPPSLSTTVEGQRVSEREESETPVVVVVTPEQPAIVFSVPTMGNLSVPIALAQAPPSRPLQPPAPLLSVPSSLRNTGTGGMRPVPHYPELAREQAQQGSVVLLLKAGEGGRIVAAEIKGSSGFRILDRSAQDHVLRRWTVPPGDSNRWFEATITYRLQKD